MTCMTKAVLLRRRKLGRGSTNGIKDAMENEAQVVRNWRTGDWPREPPAYIFRWGCTSNVPYEEWYTIVNSARSIHWCSDKKQGRLDMQEAGVPVPITWDAMHFRQTEENTNFTYVLRRSVHSQGRDLWHGSWADIMDAMEDNNVTDGYVSEFIDKVAEYRVMVVCGRAVWVARKTPGNPEDVAWNVAAGGRFDNVRWGEWPLAVVKAALQAADVSDTDFCGVDVMVDAAGNPYVLEVNSAPSQTSPYRQQCVAKAFDYIVTNGKDHFPSPERFDSWKDVIHPAVWSRDNG